MMFTTRMKYLVSVVLDTYTDEVTKKLLKLGVLHFVKVTELSGGLEKKVDKVQLSIPLSRLAEIRKRIESFLSIINVTPKVEEHADIDSLEAVQLEETEKELDAIAGEIQTIRDRQKTIQSEILRLSDINRQVMLFGDLSEGMKNKSTYSFLNMHPGMVSTARLQDFKAAFENVPSVVLTFNEEEGKTYAMVITMKRDDAVANTILDRFGFLEVELTPEMMGNKEGVAENIAAKILKLEKEQTNLSRESNLLIEAKQEQLEKIWKNLRLNELYNSIQSYYSKTTRTVLFSGWVPANMELVISRAIAEATKGKCYLEWQNPDSIERDLHHKVNVPVQLKNAKILSPFQMLVTNFSIPGYGTIDPTPFVAVIYLIMFGLMFADIGQGLVLMVAGFIGFLFRRKIKDGLTELLKLIIFCGGASVVFGALFGSCFGFGWFPALWFDFHGLLGGHVPADSPVKDILSVLLITLYFGIGVIIFGLVLNWINCIREKRWIELFFDRTGFTGTWMYLGGIYVAWFFVNSSFKSFPDSTTLLFLLGIPSLLFYVKSFVEFFHHKKHDPMLRFSVFSPVRFFLDWFVEMLEVFSGYLSNTLSFMRVAGLGIAHTALMIAFFKIANIASNNEVNWIYIVILVIGNIFVILLEGLSAGIQSLRLNYYEFFSKYFRGAGKAYSPVSLRNE
ncbi:MAG: ATPase V [Spirochaetales bacterium]|nr:ATPase V [Spirochaetales bacterium]